MSSVPSAPSSSTGAASEPEYIIVNKANWDERAPEHAKSPGYSYSQQLTDPDRISPTVTFDRPLLGDVTGLDMLHLQCHIGTDTLSLARLGARRVTGLDFSPAAIAAGKHLVTNAAGGEKLAFVESTVEKACEVLPAGEFDMVYTGIGALCWIPYIKPWAATVAKLLKPGGKLFVREGHPVLWAIDETKQTSPTLRLPYWETGVPFVEESEGTYVPMEEGRKLENTRSMSFNHGLGETLTALVEEGMEVRGLVEHGSVPWEALPGQMVKEGEDEWVMREEGLRGAVPLTYTLWAVKKVVV